jgi:hypothetical protein
MATKIDGYKTLLTRITVAQNVQLHKDVTEQIEPLTGNVSGLLPSYTEYKANFISLDTEFNRKNKSIETDELAGKDDRRDATTVQLTVRVDYHFKFPQNDGEKEAARVLKFITDTYHDAPHKNYQAETSYLRNMIAELRKNESRLNLFGLTSLVNRLDKENTAFETLYNTRTNAKETKRERGTLTELAAKTNESFDVMCQIINGMLLMPFDGAVTSALEQIVSLLNAQIRQYTVVYNRRAGMSGKKKAEENEQNIKE